MRTKNNVFRYLVTDSELVTVEQGLHSKPSASVVRSGSACFNELKYLKMSELVWQVSNEGILGLPGAVDDSCVSNTKILDTLDRST